MAESIYDFTVKDAQGNDVSLSKYKGDVLLIVNTATGCGFTPQYKDLEDLYERFHDRGFEILDFPCNQFGHQAPGTNEEIVEFCTLNYNTQFPTFAKIDVNGPDESPLYKFLKSKKKSLLGAKIKWNFEKFLVDRNGNVVDRFGSTTNPKAIADKIEALLAD